VEEKGGGSYMNRLQKRILLITIISVLSATVIIGIISVSATQFTEIPPFEETVLKDCYDSLEECDVAIEEATRKYREYVEKYKSKLSIRERNQLCEEFSACTGAARENTINALPPYEYMKYRLAESRGNPMGKHAFCYVSFEELCLDYAEEWIEHPENHQLDFHCAIVWAFRNSWETCMEERGCKRDDPEFTDAEYVAELMSERLTVVRQSEIYLSEILKESPYADFVSKFDDRYQLWDLQKNVYQDVWEMTQQTVTADQVRQAVQDYCDIDK